MGADTSKAAIRLGVATISIVVLILFARTVAFEFVAWDDNDLIWGNSLVNPPAWTGFAGSWAAPHENLYVPVTYNLWWMLARLGHWVGGPHPLNALPPWPYHAANVLIHGANALLAIAIFRRIGFVVSAAAFGAIIFAIHPLQVEAACWATGMKDLLSSFFALVGILSYLNASHCWKSGRSLQAHRWYSAALMAVFIGTLAKPGIVGVPLIAAVLDVAFVGGWRKTTFVRFAGLFLVATPSVIWTRMAQQAGGLGVPILLRPTVACHALGFYLSKVFVPSRLATDYGLRPLVVLTQGHHLWLALLVPAYTSLLLLLPRHRKMLTVAGLVFVGGVLPVLGFAPFSFQFFSTVADRYVYLSMLGVGVGAAYLASLANTRLVRQLLVVVTLGLAVLTWQQVGLWRDTWAIMGQTIRVNPIAGAAYNNLSLMISPPANLRFQVRRWTTTSRPSTAPGMVDAGKLTEVADQLLWRGLAGRPDNPLALKNLIWNRAMSGQFPEALKLAEFAYRLAPIAGFDAERSVIGPYELGWLYKEVGQRDRAIECFSAATANIKDRAAASQVLAELLSQPVSAQATSRPAASSPVGAVHE